jgi:hypothetical protein
MVTQELVTLMPGFVLIVSIILSGNIVNDVWKDFMAIQQLEVHMLVLLVLALMQRQQTILQYLVMFQKQEIFNHVTVNQDLLVIVVKYVMLAFMVILLFTQEIVNLAFATTIII